MKYFYKKAINHKSDQITCSNLVSSLELGWKQKRNGRMTTFTYHSSLLTFRLFTCTSFASQTLYAEKRFLRVTCRKSYTTCFPVKRDLNCYIEPNERQNKTGNKSNALHQWTYGLSVSILYIRTVADSGSRVCFWMLHFCPVARVI